MNTNLLLEGIAGALEVPSVTEDTVLAEAGNWDSVCVVITIGLIDELCPGVVVEGQALAECVTVGDVLRLAGVRDRQEIASGDVGSLRDVLGI